MTEIGEMDFAFELSKFTKELIDKDVSQASELVGMADQLLARWGFKLNFEIVEIEK